MNDNDKSLSTVRTDREKALAADRRNIFSMTPEKALEAVAEHPYPVTLIQSFSEEDLYLLVHTIGPDDALPILGLASDPQWEYFLDSDTWNRDRIDLPAMTRWLNRLLQADADRFTRWISEDNHDALSYYLFRNIEVRLREHDQDPSDFGEGFFSEDQTHFVRLRRIDPALETGKQFEEDRDMLVTDLLRRIAVYDYPKYVGSLLDAMAVLPAETEEELYRLRNIRLAEKGFIPHEEAVGVYQPLSVRDLLKRGRKPASTGGRRVEAYPLPAPTRKGPEGASRFARALAKIEDIELYQRLQTEFAGLCNQVIAADQVIIRQKETLQPMVAKVANFISLGLEQIAHAMETGSAQTDIELIRTHLLADLFRVGYGCALELKWQAEGWQKTAWFTREGLPLGFWGERGLGILGGLLLKKPLHYNPTGSGSFYEEFAEYDQILSTRHALDEFIAFDRLLARMEIAIGPARPQPGPLTFQNLLLTLWAAHCLGLPDTVPEPLPLKPFRQFFNTLWHKPAGTRIIRETVRKNFLAWLGRRSGVALFEIADTLGQALEGLFETIQYELGQVQERHLDPRFIHLFLVADNHR